jgi:hypothetical protein
MKNNEDQVLKYYDDPNWSWLVWGRHFIEEQQRLLGDDPWPSGIKKNRTNLERFLEYFSVESYASELRFGSTCLYGCLGADFILAASEILRHRLF